MSSTLDEITARADKAANELDRLAEGNPGANWRWSIPARPDRDTDLILSASQMDVPRLVAALRAVDRLAAHTDKTHAELPLPHGPLTTGYGMAIRDVRAMIRTALG